MKNMINLNSGDSDNRTTPALVVVQYMIIIIVPCFHAPILFTSAITH